MEDELRDQLSATLRGIPAEGEGVRTELVQEITARIGSSIKPVKPLQPTWVLVIALVTAMFGVAAAGGAILGLYGVRAMSLGHAGVIFGVLAAFAVLTAAICVEIGIPGSYLWVSPAVLLTAEASMLVALFVMCFDDYDTEDFVVQGVRCLIAGSVQAAPGALLIALILRRCFPLRVRSAMLARGLLAGLAGVIMLELHCPRLQVPHLAVWHTAVLPLSAMASVFVAGLVSRRPPPVT